MNKRINQSELPKSKLTSLNATSLDFPKIVKIGIYLFFISVFLDFISLFYDLDLILELMQRKNSTITYNKEIFLITIYASFMIFIGIIYWFIYKGRDWARITIAVLTVCSFVFDVLNYIDWFSVSRTFVIFDLFLYAISFSSVLCFFTPKANVWFAAIKNSRNECIAE